MKSDPAVKHTQAIFDRSYIFEYALIALTVLSFLLVFINSNYKHISPLQFDPSKSTVITDRIKPKGESTAQINADNPYSFSCNLIKSDYRNIFCAYQIYLGVSDVQGYDFSEFDDLLIDLDYEGASDSIRIQLLNYNSAYAQPSVINTAKFNLVEFEKEAFLKPKYIKLSEFKVADWWPSRNNVDFSLAKRELNNIIVIQIQTGSDFAVGEHTFTVNDIQLTKQLFSNEALYLALLCFWIVIILILLILRLGQQRKQLTVFSMKNAHLEQENAYLNSLSENLSSKDNIDSHTNIYNFTGIRAHIDAIWNNRISNVGTLAYIFISIDHFNKFNDSLGEEVGEAVLLEFTQLINKNIRRHDIFGRYYNDTFIIISKNTTLDNAINLANKLKSKLLEHNFNLGITVSASFGVGALNSHETTQQEFIDQTTEALDYAKNRGSNQVRYYDNEINQPS